MAGVCRRNAAAGIAESAADAGQPILRPAGPGCIQWNGWVKSGLYPGLPNGTVKENGKQFTIPWRDMATATAAPAQETEKKAPLYLTPQAIAKVREIMATQDPLPAGLRIGVVGGGCSGFQYSWPSRTRAA